MKVIKKSMIQKINRIILKKTIDFQKVHHQKKEKMKKRLLYRIRKYKLKIKLFRIIDLQIVLIVQQNILHMVNKKMILK